MKKQEKNQLTIFLNSILSESKILEFYLADFEDDDINFFIFPKLDLLPSDEEESFMFIIYCSDKKTLNIYCPTLYTLKNNDSVMFTLNAINIINSKVAIGKLYLNEFNRTVISYLNRILFNDITKELTVELLEDYVKSFIMTSVEFYKQMRETYHDKND